MSSKLFAAAIAAALLGSASLAHAANFQTVDLSPYVNQSLNNGWSIDGLSTVFNVTAPFAGVTTGNEGLSTPFNVAFTGDQNSFWYGLNEGANNLFATDPDHPVLNSITIAVTNPNVQSVYTLANNTFGRFGVDEFNIVFQGAGGTITDQYIGGQNTQDYNTPNCATTGCSSPTGSTPWYFDGTVLYSQVQWNLPANFGLTSITFNQVDGVDGAILMGVTLGVPEPATWALMIGGFGLAGAALRRRRAAFA